MITRITICPLGILLGLSACGHFLAAADEPANQVSGTLITLQDNGAWSWFMDDRAIIDGGKLIVGSVRSVGNFSANQSDPRWGNVEVAICDLATREVERTVLHQHLEQDDHDSPAFLALPDGRYLAMYTKHAVERKINYRFSEPRNPRSWSAAQIFAPPGGDSAFGGDNVTYSNLFQMPDGRIYNFYRGFSHDPNYMFSDDRGTSWKYGGRLLRGRDGYSPYLKYAFDPQGTLHFVATEDHPRNYDNSVYHGYLRDGAIHDSRGTRIAGLSTTTEPSLAAWDLTRIFQGDADNVAWVIDLELDGQQQPYLAFSVQKDGRGLPRGQGGMDLRYIYARWRDARWQVHEMAHAGTRLYPGEDDYPGLVALHPHNPDVVFISTDADPVTGKPLISSGDGRRHHELFQGKTSDVGATWQWTAITRNSTVDNLRPIVPKWPAGGTALVWLRGRYVANHGEWTTAVVAMILP